MIDFSNIVLPSKPKVVKEDGNEAIYEITGLYPGYGYTLGNALRRMLLSSIVGIAPTKIRIKGVPHEFATIDGVKEEVLMIILNIKKIKVKLNVDEFPQTIKLNKKGKGKVTAGDFSVPSQIAIVNEDLHIAEITDEKAELNIEVEFEKGIGFMSREDSHKNRTEIGIIMPDAFFSPIKRSYYEVENVRIGNRTDFNKLRIFIETNGTVSPREAFEKAIKIMITQFEAMIGFQTEDELRSEEEVVKDVSSMSIEDLSMPNSIINTLSKEGVKTVGGILRKRKSGISSLNGIGEKAIKDIEKALVEQGVRLKD